MAKQNSERIVPGEYKDVTPEPSEQDSPDVETLHTLMRLVLGGAVEGTDELIRRLKERQAETSQSAPLPVIISPDETELDRLRYAFIGFLFQSPHYMLQGVSNVERATRRATGLASKLFSPITNSRLMQPARQRYESIAARGESILESWIKTGRAEEHVSRILVRRSATGVIDEFIEYLADNPEIRAVVQQQSVGLAGEIVGEVRNRTASADNLVERVARSVLRLPLRETQPVSTIGLPAGSETTTKQPERK